MYTPQRDNRFEYIWDAMEFIEDNQCKGCKFKSDDEEYPMCHEVLGRMMKEKPMKEIDDLGDQGIKCNRWEQEVIPPPEPTLLEKLQLPLWEG